MTAATDGLVLVIGGAGFIGSHIACAAISPRPGIGWSSPTSCGAAANGATSPKNELARARAARFGERRCVAIEEGF